MHARLRGRWRGARKIPLIPGGWYPVTDEGKYDVTVRADGAMVCLTSSELELSDAPRTKVVLACEVEGQGIVGVCPRGHHIPEVSIMKAVARCAQCDHVYEVEA